ncbi:hypothetical protein SANTM175S_03312 [Streptomyces antimycoticus]
MDSDGEGLSVLADRDAALELFVVQVGACRSPGCAGVHDDGLAGDGLGGVDLLAAGAGGFLGGVVGT